MSRSPQRVALLALPGVNLASLYCAVDDLATVGVRGAYVGARPALDLPLHCRVVAPEAGPITASGGRRFLPQRRLEQLHDCALVYVPVLGPDAPQDFDPRLLAWVQARHAAGAMLAAIASGAALLSACGLLDDAPATWRNDIWYPRVDADNRHALRVEGPDGRIITTAGTCAGHHDLVAYLVQRLCGRVALQAFLQHRGRHWQGHLREADAALAETVAIHDAGIRQALRWLDRHLAVAAPLAGMAAELGLSQRGFSRRFKAATGQAPLARVQARRIEAACRLLQQTALPVTEVAAQVGYRDPAAFRKLFRARTGRSPQEYRQRFGMAPPD